MLKEFREFISRGNVLDLAVGVVIGGAFGAIVDSFVKDIIMPPLGLLIGGVDFSALKIVLQAASADGATAEVAIRYGAFINLIINFLIVALAVFAVVKAYNASQKKAETPAADAAPPAPTASETLLAEIRDLLKQR
ncbi:MAG: large-conductance mechanosensitive channel protein MscL [Bacteroidia bacterium]|nr:large-conductance mechanosensitive channel protein MscL [Bacteroidia bacterium]